MLTCIYKISHWLKIQLAREQIFLFVLDLISQHIFIGFRGSFSCNARCSPYHVPSMPIPQLPHPLPNFPPASWSHPIPSSSQFPHPPRQPFCSSFNALGILTGPRTRRCSLLPWARPLLMVPLLQVWNVHCLILFTFSGHYPQSS